ncbi:MAG: hypothetical protein C4522_04275 [Desulfobacteraceae bacterium]|nr:MAG: hypothetical protein C4522_04275 [Desulfobacteraceae bacterium]
MNQKIKPAHRRKWKRFTIQSGALVILQKPRLMGILGQAKIKFGPIVNISMGGLAVQYIENKNRMKNYTELSIATPAKKQILDRISFEVIADFPVAALPDGKKIRNRCVKFHQMTSYHTFQLDDFIREFSTSYIMDRRSGEERRKFDDPRYQDPAWSRKHEKRSGLDRRAYPVIL